MRWISRRVWRAVHFSSFALFVVSTIHGLTAGTDAGNMAVRWFALTSCAVVGFLTLVRLLSEHKGPRTPARTGARPFAPVAAPATPTKAEG